MPEEPITPPPSPFIVDLTDQQVAAQALLDQLDSLADNRVGGRHVGVARTHMETVVDQLNRAAGGPPPGPIHMLPPVGPPPE